MIGNRFAGLAAVLALTCFATPALAGPFCVSVPIDGLTPKHGEALIKELRTTLSKRGVLQPKVSEGVLEFYGGGEGPKSLVRLSSIKAAAKAVGLVTTPTDWTLKAQTVGLTLSSAEPLTTAALHEALTAFAGSPLEVQGTLLDRRRLVVVVHIKKAVAFAALAKHLGALGVTIDDLVWGHWKYGWGFDQHGNHRHDNGATRAKK